MKGLFPKIKFDINNLASKKQIAGHIVESLTIIQENIAQKSSIILLDSGCVYKSNEGLGYLSAMDLDTYELISQENID